MKTLRELVELYAFPESLIATEQYLEKYWINDNLYKRLWQPLERQIFNQSFSWFPEMVFNLDYEVLPTIGGLIFEKEDFEKLKACMQLAGDTYFVIVEDMEVDEKDNSKIRLVYPSNINWNEIKIDDGLSFQLFQSPNNNYFVYGNSGKWGKYVANDYSLPLDILGFKKSIASIFMDIFYVSNEDKLKIASVLPNYSHR